MGNLVYPSLPGLTFGHSKTPEWKTNIHKAVSGKEFRTAWMSAPLYTFRLQYEFLRDATSYAELQSLIAFFNNCQGSFDSFLFTDPSDKSVNAQSFGTGNGVQTAFQLMRSFGGNLEAVGNLNGAPQIYKTDWQGRLLQSASPRTNLVKQSQNLMSGWGPVCLVTASAGSYLGVVPFFTVAKTLAQGSESIGQQIGAVLNGSVMSVTVALMAGSSTSVSVGLYGSVSAWGANSDATAQILSGNGTLAQAVGGYWNVTGLGAQPTLVRLTRTYRATNNCFVLFYPGTAGSVTPGDSVQITRVQVENGAGTDSYIPTTTTAVTVTDYSLSSTGVVTFASAPAAGALLDWTGNYFYRCRFLQDSMDFSKFMNALWEAKKVEFIGSLSPNRI